MARRKPITEGDTVRLKRSTRGVERTAYDGRARVTVEDDAYASGAVKVSPALGGFGWWNKADLVKCAATEATR